MSDDVIVADNDGIIRGLVRSILHHLGFNVLLARDGMEAIDLANRTLARLVILDFKMPRLNGFVACEQIRQLPNYAETPIIILTVFSDTATQAAARAAGASAFMAKPFSIDGLRRAVTRLVSPDDR